MPREIVSACLVIRSHQDGTGIRPRATDEAKDAAVTQCMVAGAGVTPIVCQPQNVVDIRQLVAEDARVDCALAFRDAHTCATRIVSTAVLTNATSGPQTHTPTARGSK